MAFHNPIDNPGQIAAERDVIALWQTDTVRQARELVGRAWRSGWGDQPPVEIEPMIEAHIDEYATNWLFKAAASDAQHPRFVRDFMRAYDWHGHRVPGARTGGDNPDNVYRLAGIAHGIAYRVTAQIVGTKPANVSFTLVGNYGTSVTIQTIEDHELAAEPDGSFVVTIDDRPAEGRRNHITTAPHAKFLFVRDSLDDWAETPLDLRIERLGAPSRGPLTHDEMATAAAFRMREDVGLYHWFQSIWTARRPNTYMPVQQHRGMGGLVSQALSHGHFRIAEDEGVLIEYEPAGAGYVSIELCDWLYRSLDADEIQSSLTRAQSTIDVDGRIRAVIARRDPGIANWLDCGGRETVLVIHRWQALPPEPVNGGPFVAMTHGKLSALLEALPADTRSHDAADRTAQLDRRRAAYRRRITPND